MRDSGLQVDFHLKPPISLDVADNCNKKQAYAIFFIINNIVNTQTLTKRQRQQKFWCLVSFMYWK